MATKTKKAKKAKEEELVGPETVPEGDVSSGIPDDDKSVPKGEKSKDVEKKSPVDMGVEQLAGSPDEPVGPEDIGGIGPKRGDYEDRILPSLTSHEVVRTDGNTGGAGQLVENEDGGIDRAPHSAAVPQAPRAVDQGEVPGQKGGVDTDPRTPGRPAVS